MQVLVELVMTRRHRHPPNRSAIKKGTPANSISRLLKKRHPVPRIYANKFKTTINRERYPLTLALFREKGPHPHSLTPHSPMGK